MPLSPGGGEVLKSEDLRRDASGLFEWPPAEFFKERMLKMDADDFREGEGWSCAFREGAEGTATRVLRSAWPTDVDGAISTAVLISLAKAWNRPEPLTHPTWMCMARPDATGLPDGDQILMGPFTSGALELGAHIHCGEPNPAATLSELNDNWLKRQTHAVWDHLEGKKTTAAETRRTPPPRR